MDFVGKVFFASQCLECLPFYYLPLSLLFNMLSRLVIALLPRSKRLLISWLQSLSAVILEPKKLNKKRKKERKIFKKSFTISIVHSITSQCS